MNSKTIIAIVHAGDRIPFDGKIIDGVAIVDESAETGVSTPALLDSDQGRNNVFAGTLVLEGWLKIESSLDARIKKRDVDRPATRDNTHCFMKTDRTLKTGAIILAVLGAAISFTWITYLTTQSWIVTVAAGVFSFSLGVYEIWKLLVR